MEDEGPAWGKAIKVLRLTRRWNRRQLAQATGVAASTITRYEKGDRSLDPEDARRLVSAMGFPLNQWERALAFVASTEAARASTGNGPVAEDGGIDTIAGIANTVGQWTEELVRETLARGLVAARRQQNGPARRLRQEVADVDPARLEPAAELHTKATLEPAPSIGEVLAILRAIRGWERQDLAKAVGRPEETLANYEQDKTVPKTPAIQELLAAQGFAFATFASAVEFVRSARKARRLAWGGAKERQAADRRAEGPADRGDHPRGAWRARGRAGAPGLARQGAGRVGGALRLSGGEPRRSGASAGGVPDSGV